MNETPKTTAPQLGHIRQVPRRKLWIIGGLFLLVAFGMYAGTMYRIQNYGYLGISDDRPIQNQASGPQTTNPKPN
ncbi:MAG: hypothetical protein JKY27_14355 [Magnetovibrio sp.]|nr:hypothetical protein [Magnetovibrio sp.]